MDRIFIFLKDYVLLIFIILFIVLVITIRKYIHSIHQNKEAIFGLEIELAKQGRTLAKSLLGLIIVLISLEFLIVFIIFPINPEILSISTPTKNSESISARTIPPEFIATIIARTPGATTTFVSSTCIPGMIMISYPKVGDQVRGNISIMGTADIPNFGFYKYEFSPGGTESWTTIQAGREIKINTKLGDWDTSELTPGDYLLRLVVLDNQGQIFPACVIPVRVSQP